MRMDEELEELRGRIEEWRRTREKLGPMPEEFWDKATYLAQRLSVGTVSRKLKVGDAGLRKRAERAGRAPSAGSKAIVPRFVEVSGVQAGGGLGSPSAVLRVESGHGASLTIHLSSSSGLDVLALVSAFGRRGR
jgi:hypothetical protein